jgi:hypothetical protein
MGSVEQTLSAGHEIEIVEFENLITDKVLLLTRLLTRIPVGSSLNADISINRDVMTHPPHRSSEIGKAINRLIEDLFRPKI